MARPSIVKGGKEDRTNRTNRTAELHNYCTERAGEETGEQSRAANDHSGSFQEVLLTHQTLGLNTSFYRPSSLELLKKPIGAGLVSAITMDHNSKPQHRPLLEMSDAAAFLASQSRCVRFTWVSCLACRCVAA
jgi:hypothetical protein